MTQTKSNRLKLVLTKITRYFRRLAEAPRLALIHAIRVIGETSFDESRHRSTIQKHLLNRANESSAIFIEKYLPDVLLFTNDKEIRTFSVSLCKENQLGNQNQYTCLEFGVWKGESLGFWSSQFPNAKVVGFDSFEGLSENWGGTGMPKGTFNLAGVAPRVSDNVELVAGWVEDTVEGYLGSNVLGTIMLVHLDLDTFTPTSVVLRALAPYLKKGGLLLFDEYFGYPGWQHGEHKALVESGLNFRYLAFSTGISTGVNQALVEII